MAEEWNDLNPAPVEEAENALKNNDDETGKIVFANDVIATIAALAAAEIEGIEGMNGGVMGDMVEIFGKKNVTKGVKVDVNEEECRVDLSVNVRFGYKIREVCTNLQENVRSAIETMTGLHVTMVNVFVQSVTFDQNNEAAEEKKRAKELRKAEKEAAKAAREAEKEAAALEEAVEAEVVEAEAEELTEE